MMTTTTACREPYGYRRDESTRALVPHDAEQGIVKLVLTLRDRGHTPYAIAKQLDAWGLPPRVAPSWSSNAIRRILRRLDAHSDGDARAALEALYDAPRCPWCNAGVEISGDKPNCRRCGHRHDLPRFRCDCPACKLDH